MQHEAATLLHTRLTDVKRPFPHVLDLSGGNDKLSSMMTAPERMIVSADLLGCATGIAAAVDEECLPFAAQSFDLIVGNMTLHLVNDLPGALVQIRQILKSDGMLLAALLGGDSLVELRDCLMEAEMMLMGGVSPRVHPVIDLPMASGLMQRAGFVLPVVDSEFITLAYPDIFTMMRDLRGMGGANLHHERLRRPTPRKVFQLAEKLYRDRYVLPDGQLPLTFEIIFLHGWASA